MSKIYEDEQYNKERPKYTTIHLEQELKRWHFRDDLSNLSIFLQ